MELRVKLKKRFKDFNLDVDFTISQDRIGIFGPSGSGKSTLLSLIAGLRNPDNGLIMLNGQTLFDKKINLSPDQRRIGMIFQNPHLFPHLSVKSNLLYGYKRCSPENRKIDFNSLVEVLKLGQLLNRGVNNLSGGEKQRVVIGRAVLSNPRLLLMDEPLSALDDTLRFKIINHLKSVCSTFNIPYLFISHSMLEMRLMAEHVMSIAEGNIVSFSTADELARHNLGSSQVGFINLLKLGRPYPSGGLFAYPWGSTKLLLSVNMDCAESIAELSSKDIMLFKKHPEATSARNLIQCDVKSLFYSGRKIGIELACCGNTLIAEVAREAVDELNIKQGKKIYAAIKSSAFRMLPD